jgi:hypothetical protein
MKKILLAVLLCASTITYAQNNSGLVTVNKPVLCTTIENLFKTLASKEVNEKPVWTGVRDDNKTQFFLFLNFETSAYTFVESGGKEMACVIGMGYKSDFFDPPDTGKKMKLLSLP